MLRCRAFSVTAVTDGRLWMHVRGRVLSQRWKLLPEANALCFAWEFDSGVVPQAYPNVSSRPCGNFVVSDIVAGGLVFSTDMSALS